jgi:hypothetical protein
LIILTHLFFVITPFPAVSNQTKRRVVLWVGDDVFLAAAAVPGACAITDVSHVVDGQDGIS